MPISSHHLRVVPSPRKRRKNHSGMRTTRASSASNQSASDLKNSKKPRVTATRSRTTGHKRRATTLSRNETSSFATKKRKKSRKTRSNLISRRTSKTKSVQIQMSKKKSLLILITPCLLTRTKWFLKIVPHSRNSLKPNFHCLTLEQ